MKIKVLIPAMAIGLVCLVGFAKSNSYEVAKSTIENDISVEICGLEDNTENLELTARLSDIDNRKKEDQELGNFIFSLMDIVRAKLSPVRKQIVTRTIIRVVNDVLDTKQQKESFAVLLSMESKFDNTVSSKAGAQGISQIMTKYAPEFAKICGISDYRRSDLKDLELNLYLGACQFKALLDSPSINGNTALSLVGYNAGKNSKSFKQMVNLRNISVEETSNYVARYTYLREEVKILIEKEELAVAKKGK